MPERQRLSILVKNLGAPGATLYVRGTADAMKNLTNLDERSKKYNKMLDFNSHRGYQTFVFASKKVSQAETESYYKSYQSAARSALDREKNLSVIAEKLETNLMFEGAVGLIKKLKPHAADVVQQSKLMGVRAHMLSGDSFEACKRSAVALKFFSGSTNLIELNFSDMQGGRAQIKKVLELITKQMSMKKTAPTIASLGSPFGNFSANVDPELFRAKNLVLSISGSCLEVARTNRWVHEHLKLIFEFASTIVGHEMRAAQKAQAVQLLSELGRTTMAVGDGHNDILMLKRASVGVQLQSPSTELVFGDLLVTNLSTITRCLNLKGRQFNNNLNLATDAAYQHSLLLLVLNMTHQLYSAASGVPILSSGYLLLIGLLLIPVNLVFVFLGKTYEPVLRSKIPQLYAEHKAINNQIFTKWFLRQNVLPAIFEGIVLGVLMIQVLDDQMGHEGSVTTSETLKLVLCLAIIFLHCIKLVINCKIARFSTTAIMLVVVGVIFTITGISQTRFDAAPIMDLWGSPNQILLVLLYDLVLGMLYLGMWEVRWSPLFHPIGEHLHRCMYARPVEAKDPEGPNKQGLHLMTEPAMGEFSRQGALSIKSNMVGEFGFMTQQLDSFEAGKSDLLFGSLIATDSFSTIYKNCFETDSEISEQVMKLLFPNDQGGDQEQAFRQLLAFKSRSIGKKFAVYVFDKFYIMSRFTLCTICVCFAVYLLVDGILDIHKDWDLLWTRVMVFLLVVVLHWLAFGPKFARKSAIYSVLLLGFFVVGSVLYSGLTRSDYSLAGVVMLAYLSTQYVIGYQNYLIWCGLAVLGLTFGYVANYQSLTEVIVIDRPTAVPVFRIVSLFAGILVSYLLERYHNELLVKREFLSGASLEGTNLFAKELLGLLLPKFILEEMENPFEITTKPKVIDDGVNVSILFCDIAEFDEVVRLQENSIIGLLDGIFKKFDDLCTIHGVQKIETVGKTYMAAAGLKKVDDALPFDLVKIHPTQRVLNLAKDMMNHIHEQTSLDLKIGIHVGKPVMGVIGFHKPQFSLIGDVVNTTSRHCTTGKKGRIMMSQAAWETVEYQNPLSQGYSKEVVPTEMKGKGSVMVYQLYHAKKRLIQHLESIITRKSQFSDQESLELVERFETLINYMKRKKHKTINFADVVLQVKPMDTLKNAFIKLGPLSAQSLQNRQPVYRSSTGRFPEQSSIVDSSYHRPSKRMFQGNPPKQNLGDQRAPHPLMEWS